MRKFRRSNGEEIHLPGQTYMIEICTLALKITLNPSGQSVMDGFGGVKYCVDMSHTEKAVTVCIHDVAWNSIQSALKA